MNMSIYQKMIGAFFMPAFKELMQYGYERKLPIRLIITDTPINMAVTIDDFSYTIGRDGDMKYSITLSEVKLI